MAEVFHFLSLAFDVDKARKLVEGREPMQLRPQPTGFTSIDETYAMSDAVDPSQPGIIVVLPNGLGGLLIDGNHRCYKAAQLNLPTWPVHVLKGKEVHSVCLTKPALRRLEKAEGAQC